MWVLRRNIRLVLAKFPMAVVVISDNASSDGTWTQLLRLALEQERVVLMRNRVNIGLSRNLGNALMIPERATVLLLGVNDFIVRSGLNALAHSLRIGDLWDVTIFNWAYSRNADSYGSVHLIGDVTKQFTVRRLEDYLDRNPYVPNGIMQLLVKRRYFRSIRDHYGSSSPHVGVFFDMFPCRARSAGRVLCAVRHTETSGWRSSAKNILLSHVALLSEITRLKSRRLTPSKFRKLHRRYSLDIYGLVLSMRTEAGWGGRLRLGPREMIVIASKVSLARTFVIVALAITNRRFLAKSTPQFVLKLLIRIDAALAAPRRET